MFGRLHYCDRIRAIARNTASLSEVLEGFPSTQMRQNHPEACRTALNLRLLEQGRHLDSDWCGGY